MDLPAGTVVDTSGINDRSGSGLQARNQGKITADGVTVITTGNASMGVDVTSNSQVDLTNTTITTGGIDGHGIYILYGTAKVTAAGITINTTGQGANGVHAFRAAVSLDGSNIETSGDSAKGIYSSNLGGSVTAVNTTISTEGVGAAGAVAESGGSLSFSGGSITTTGANAFGVYANGVFANGTASMATVSDLTIETSGQSSAGAVAESGGSLSFSGGSIGTTGEAGYGLYISSASSASIDHTAIDTAGDTAHGVYIVNAASSVAATATMISTSGKGSSGIRAEDGGQVTADGLTIETRGDDSDAISIHDTGTQVTFAGGSITTTGDNANGVFAEGGSVVNLQQDAATGTGVLIRAGGVGSNGISATTNSIVNAQGVMIQAEGDGAGVLLNDGASASLAQSLIQSATGPALKTNSGEGTFTLTDGTVVSSDSGVLFSGTAGSQTTIIADNNVTLIGDMVVDQATTGGGALAVSGTLQASLTSGSSWKGAAKGVTGASIDGSSSWLMTASSDIGTLSNDGTIEFDSANSYKTLTLGTLAINGGSFILNTKLNKGGAVSETDRIIVTGDANGTGLITVRNNGGTGASTGTGATDGIKVVEVGGASNAEFKLGSAAIVGIYDYHLIKADGQNWYLQSKGPDVVTPPVDPVDPVIPPVNPGPGTGHVVDIVPGYNIALSAAQNHVLTSLDTFHERLGELRAEDLNDGYHAWMRGIGKAGSYSPRSVTGYSGHGFDMRTAGVQIGADYSKSDVFVADDKLTIGIFGEYANSSFDVRGRTADGSISSKGLGGYVTWQQNAPTDHKSGTGVYVDAVVKQDWLNFGVNAMSVTGFHLQNGYEGRATTASIETGYGVDLGNNLVLQPQAQLIWSKLKADDFTDPYGIAVHDQKAASLIGRLGMRLEKTFYFGDNEANFNAATGQVQEFSKSVVTYADINAKHEYEGGNGLNASNTAIGNDMGGTHYDVGAGVVVRASENVSLFGRGSVEFSGSTNIARKASGGLKLIW